MSALELILKEKIALSLFNKATNSEFTYLRPLQIQCLRAILCQDVVAIMPTGYGKSLIYELLPFYSKSVKNLSSAVIVTVPLNAIIDQELKKLGDLICSVNENTGVIKKKDFYIGHPEDILTSASLIFQSTRSAQVIFIIVDEAHCVLEWGEDFRPDYRHIADLRSYFENAKMLATTATASKIAQEKIAKHLGMLNYLSINCTPVLNPNVTISICKRIPSTGGDHNVTEAYNFVFKPLLLDLMKLKENFPLTIVYCKLQWCGYGVELASRLIPSTILNPNTGFSRVVQYHAQQPRELNQEIVSSIASPNSPILLIFATIALGMGCDLRHVRRVVHAGPPSSMEAYVQEIGRAGRDGTMAEAILYYNATDLCHEYVDNSMKEFCSKKDICKRIFITNYFNTVYSTPSENCCDFCMNSVLDITNFISAKLVQRQTMKDSLEAYASIDSSNSLSENSILTITDTFEYLNDCKQIQDIFDVPTFVAKSVLQIKESILQM